MADVLCLYTFVALFSMVAVRLSVGPGVWSERMLAGMAALLTIGVVVNIWYFTTESGGTLSSPVLQNWDARRTWEKSLNVVAGTPLSDPFFAYDTPGLLYGALMRLTGVSILYPLMFNVLCALLAICCVGRITILLTGRRDTACLAMLMMGLMCYFMVQATVLIKDCPVTLASALMVLCYIGPLCRQDGRPGVAEVLFMSVAVVLTVFFRQNMLMLFAAGAIFFVVRGADARRTALWAAVVLAVCTVAKYLAQMVLPVVELRDIIVHDRGLDMILVEPKTLAWDNFIGDYPALSVWRKLALLPLSILLQFLIPFPWNFGRDMVFGPTLAVAHFGYFWYFAGALVLYWIASLSRRSPAAMCRVVAYGMFLTVITAYVTSGRVSRYCLPYLPMLIPAAAYTAVTAWRRRSLRLWLAVFAALLLPGLCVCHYLQMRAL